MNIRNRLACFLMIGIVLSSVSGCGSKDTDFLRLDSDQAASGSETSESTSNTVSTAAATKNTPPSATVEPSATATTVAPATGKIPADITQDTFNSLCEPLEIIADMKYFDDYEFLADSKLSNEEVTYFLIEYRSYFLSEKQQDYSAEGIDVQEYAQCVKLSKEEVATLIQSVFGPEAFDINQYSPEKYTDLVIEDNGNYYVSFADPGNSQVTYTGESPLPYSADTEYVFDLTPPYDDVSPILDVSMSVTLVQDENSIFGYYIGSVTYDQPF